MIFPFTAIVGQDEMKTALVLNVIDPAIGGLLIMGEKGTAKSTAVRALAELLPEIEVVRAVLSTANRAASSAAHAGSGPRQERSSRGTGRR